MYPEFQPSTLNPQPSAFSPQRSFIFRAQELTVFCFFSTFGVAFAATPSYLGRDIFPIFSSAELACQDVFTSGNNWQLVKAEFDSDYDGRYSGLNTRSITGICEIQNSSPNTFFLRFVAECPAGYFIVTKKGSSIAQCITEKLDITLTPLPQTPPDPRPANTGGKSTLELKATVTENGSPKKDVAVTFGVEVIANSGGHDHHDASRPKGKVTPTNGVTDANGEFKITFKAEEFAGTHVVAAVCESCSNKSATRNVDVKVPDLIELQGDFSRGAKYELIGDTPEHKGNHFFTPAAKEALKNLLPVFAEFNWGVVGVNDSSLKWGGRFDIAGHWGGGHKEHRDGKEVDLSFYKPFGTITEDKRKKVYDDLYKSRGVGLPQVLWHKEDNPDPKNPSKAHFHVYLLGQSFFRETKY